MRGRPAIDLTGQHFGELTALRKIGKTKHGNAIWRCLCLACQRTADVPAGDLRSGHTTSCGCTKARKIAEARTVHGAKAGGGALPEYVIWCAIIQRCTNKNCPAYKYYGARGIKVCTRWRNSFKLFLKDMGFRPSTAHSIERKVNSLGYIPSNCVWATIATQANNRRNNHVLEYSGERYTLTQLARLRGIKQTTLRARLKRGLSVEEAVQAG